MPAGALSFCVVPGCSRLARGRCAVHKVIREHERRNWDVRRWYRTPRWRALRRLVFEGQDYRCAVCRRVALRLELDHKVKHCGDPGRFWDRGNLQALCKPCHSAKSQRGE
jgi:5-methylcytosine-specific restriction endonuclease McrA